MSKSALIKSSLAKKYWMALTGLFLILFLIAHLIGNLQLLAPNGDYLFNAYAAFMTSNPLIKTMSYVTYISILFHAVDGIILTVQNRRARPIMYVKNRPNANSKWYARNMAVLGSLILIFIVLHMSHFWAKMHFEVMPMFILKDGSQVKDLYLIVYDFFSPKSGGFATLFYVLSMAVLSFHLLHGFKSAFQSLGIYNLKYNGFITQLGYFIAIVIPFLFALIPIIIYFNLKFF